MTDLFPLQQIEDTTSHDSWQPQNLNNLPEIPPVQPTLGATSLLYPGKRHVFSGPPESAKTIGAYTMLIQIARTGGQGILIDFEMGGYDARQRLRELGATPEEIDHIPYIEPDEPSTPSRIDNLISYKPQLVVLDAAVGAYELEGLDDRDRLDVERIARRYVRGFWRNNIATLFIDHVVKNSEQRGNFTIGSERKLGGVDVHLGFDTIAAISRGSTGRYKITTRKDRGGYLKRGHIADLQLESNPISHEITWTFTAANDDTAEAGYFRPTRLMEEVSVHLELQSEPSTRNQIVAALGRSKDYVLKAITALVIEGYAAEEDGPNRSKLVHSASRYREDDPSCNPENSTSGSVVLCGSAVVPGPQWSGGSGGSPPYGGETTDHHHHNDPEQHGWFDTNGHLAEAPFDATWADAIARDIAGEHPTPDSQP